MRVVIRIPLAFVLATGLAAPAPAEDRPPLSFTPHEFKAEDGTKIAAELGELAVRESRSKPDSRSIRLRFVRFRSTAKKPGAPIVYLAGGPGGSGIDAARGARFPVFMALREIADVIALDQRGVGRSEPSLACEGFYAIDSAAPLSRASAESGMKEAVAACADGLRAKGIDLAAYNTRESAADLEDLRKALGVPKISLWAISYGTHLALATLKAHEASIDRVILAGVEGLDDTLKRPTDQQALLARVAALAAADPRIRAAVPDLLGSIARLRASLAEKPRAVTLVHPLTGEGGSVVVGPLDLQLAIAQLLTGPETFAYLPDFVARLERGDVTALALAVSRFRFGRTPSAMATAMDCSSGASAARVKEIATEIPSTLLGDAINLPFPGVCAAIGVPDLGDAFRAPVRASVPALLISGTLDGRTSVRNAEEVARTLPRSVSLVVEGAGHGDALFLASPKILDAMRGFLKGEPVGAARVSASAVPPFAAPRTVVELSDEELSRFVGEYRADATSVRRITKAGSLLYNARGRNMPFPLRPSSKTEFFFESIPATVRFEVDQEGQVTALLLTPSDGAAPVRNPKIR